MWCAAQVLAREYKGESVKCSVPHAGLTRRGSTFFLGESSVAPLAPIHHLLLGVRQTLQDAIHRGRVIQTFCRCLLVHLPANEG